MSLADAGVQKLLREKFICATVNLEGNPQAGFSFSHGPNDPARPVPPGLGEHNNQLLVLTPQGEIINARAGYLGSKELLAELEFSLSLYEKLGTTAADQRKETLVQLHRDFVQRGIPGVPAVRVQIQGAKVLTQKGARFALDHEFVIKNPLLPIKDFTIHKMLGETPRHLFFFGQEVIPAQPQKKQ